MQLPSYTIKKHVKDTTIMSIIAKTITSHLFILTQSNVLFIRSDQSLASSTRARSIPCFLYLK
jgi:hypothetical protein